MTLEARDMGPAFVLDRHGHVTPGRCWTILDTDNPVVVNVMAPSGLAAEVYAQRVAELLDRHGWVGLEELLTAEGET